MWTPQAVVVLGSTGGSIHLQCECVMKVPPSIGDHAVSDMLQLNQEAITQCFTNFAVCGQGLLRFLS
ncbi:hypothetical protein Plhal304r1_c031g0101511 [Plasmopara halstedii]